MSILGLGRRAVAHLSPVLGSSRCLSRSAVANSGDAIFVHRDTPDNNADMVFEFNEENKKRADAIMSIYPEVRFLPSLALSRYCQCVFCT